MTARHTEGLADWAWIAGILVLLALATPAAAQPPPAQPPPTDRAAAQPPPTDPAAAQPPPTDPAAQPPPAAAAAQPAPTAEDNERARALFEQGVREGDRGRWEDAVRNFREALRLRDAPAIRYNLGAALVELHRDAEAEPELRRVADDPAAPEELRSRARVQLEDIAERRAAAAVPTPAETAAAAPEDPADGGGGIFGGDVPWLYVGIGAAALVLVIVVVAVAASSGTDQVNGDLDPGTVVLR